MAQGANYDHEHPDYTATAALREQGRDLYEGAETVRAAGESYLFKETNETQPEYDLRLKRAVLDPYVRKIIAARQAVLWRKPPTRTLPEALQDYELDCDLKQTPADVFFEDVSREAQVEGARWVLVDMPRSPEGGYPSRAAEQAAGHRPFFQDVPAASVIDWEENPVDLELDWAVVRETVAEPRPMPGFAPVEITRWKVWTRAEWAVYEEVVDPDKPTAPNKRDTTYALADSGPNTAGAVPLVPFLGERKTDFSGYPAAREVFPHVVAIYNKTSDMDWFERLISHPIPWMVSPEPPTKLDVAKGIHFKSGPGGAQVAVGLLETTGSAFGSLRETLADLKATIFSTALAQAKKESAQVQSADSQREDRRSFTSGLRAASRHYEAQELKCWNLAAKWVNAPGGIEVLYNQDFDDEAITDAMINALSSLVDKEILTRKTFLTALVRGEVVELDGTVEEELAAVDAEASKRTAASAAETLKAMRAEGSNIVPMPARTPADGTPTPQDQTPDAGA